MPMASSKAPLTHQTTDEDVGTFYWATARGSETSVVFRRTAGEALRTVDEVCLSELSELAREVLASGKSGDSLIVAMARDLGLQRTGTAVRARLEKAIALVVKAS